MVIVPISEIVKNNCNLSAEYWCRKSKEAKKETEQTDFRPVLEESCGRLGFRPEDVGK